MAKTKKHDVHEDAADHLAARLKNVTITLDERAARWARIKAAEADISLSRFLGGILEERMREEEEYETSMRRFLSVKPARLKASGSEYPRRDQIHER